MLRQIPRQPSQSFGNHQRLRAGKHSPPGTTLRACGQLQNAVIFSLISLVSACLYPNFPAAQGLVKTLFGILPGDLQTHA